MNRAPITVEFQARYFDGQRSGFQPVRVQICDGQVLITGEKLHLQLDLAELTPDAPLGRLQRTLRMRSGGELRTDDHEVIERLFPHSQPIDRFAQKIERRWDYALASLVLLGFAIWWALSVGVPLAARPLAAMVPEGMQHSLGKQTLDAIDTMTCKPSGLTTRRTDEVNEVLKRTVHGLPDETRFQLALRNCPGLGANAFALPGGMVLVTDDLANLAQSDEQLLAVLAHEAGHVVARHGLRGLIQTSLGAVLMGTVLGDATAITGLAYALPTFLLQNGYTRAMETEADTFAFERMKAVGVSTENFAQIMTLLMQAHEAKSAKSPAATPAQDAPERTSTDTTASPHDEAPHPDSNNRSGKVIDYFSTHPATAERIRRALEYH